MNDHAAADLSRLLGPLRRSLLRATEEAGDLPSVPESHIEVMRCLAVAGRMSPGAMAAQLGLARSTVSNLVSSMSSAGLVEKRLAPSDGRSTELRLSPRASELLTRYDSASARVLDDAMARLPAADGARIRASLTSFQRLLRELGRAS